MYKIVSLCYTPETNTTLLINYTLMKKNKLKTQKIFLAHRLHKNR